MASEEVMQLKPEDIEEESEEEEEEAEGDENNEEEEGEGEEGEGEEEGEDEEETISGPPREQQSTFTYRCVICDEKFESDSDFHKHRIHHDKCPQCQQVFLCHKELIIHLSLHAVEGNICLFCRKISNTKDSFDAHLKAHRQHFKTLDCQVCGMKLLTSEEFKIHICRTRTAEEMAGGKAGEKRATITSGAVDKQSPAKRIKLEADGTDNGSGDRLADCSDVKIENLEDESGIPSGDMKIKKEPDADKPFKCGYCAEPYESSQQLCSHMTTAHPDKLT